MDLKDIVPSEISQIQTDKLCMISLISGNRKIDSHKSRENGGCRGWGWQVLGVLKEEIESSRIKVSELRWRALEESSCINITNLLWLRSPCLYTGHGTVLGSE